MHTVTDNVAVPVDAYWHDHRHDERFRHLTKSQQTVASNSGEN